MQRVCCCGPRRQEILIDCCTSGTQQQLRAVLRCLTWEAKHRLVSVWSRLDETVMLNTDILPKLNYIPMTWNDRSASDSTSVADMTSVVSAVNAAAVKYLSDQQLVQQAVAAAGSRGRSKSSRSAQRWQQPAASSSNASMYGIKSANLSLASMNYFEKHQLGNNRTHPPDSKPQSAMPRVSESKMEHLLNSITSQVNRLQMTMSPKHSAQRNSVTSDCGGNLNNSVLFNRSQSDISNGSESSQTSSTRQHVRKSFNGSALSSNVLDETCIPKRHHPSHRH